MPRYNHAFEIAFVVESEEERGFDITPAMFKAALLERIADMPDSEWIEACGAPYDTYEINAERPTLLDKSKWTGPDSVKSGPYAATYAMLEDLDRGALMTLLGLPDDEEHSHHALWAMARDAFDNGEISADDIIRATDVPCPTCHGKRYLVSERMDGRRAVEACDACYDGSDFCDTDAAKMAQADGIACDDTYPCYVREDKRTAYVVVDYDFCGRVEDHSPADDGRDLVWLEMTAFDNAGNHTGSLSEMGFFADGGDWKTGTFRHLSELAGCEHLQSTARGFGLPGEPPPLWQCGACESIADAPFDRCEQCGVPDQCYELKGL